MKRVDNDFSRARVTAEKVAVLCLLISGALCVWVLTVAIGGL